jgi:hypothetical protein
MDKLLHHIVAKIFQRGPGKEVYLVRPKQNGGLLPVSVRRERKQRSTPVTYVLPSWRKKLKSQPPDNVSEATKLDPIKGSGAFTSEGLRLPFQALDHLGEKWRPRTAMNHEEDSPKVVRVGWGVFVNGSVGFSGSNQ